MQWTNTGVFSANKFLQKVWDINYSILRKKNAAGDKKLEKEFQMKVSNYTNKIDRSIKDFRFNVSIALFYEIHKVFKNYLNKNIGDKVLKSCIAKTMKQMIPFTPHLAHECLELMGCKSKNEWPKIEKKTSEDVKMAIQINGKTRDIMSIKEDLNQEDIKILILGKSKAKKYITGKNIYKTIFVKNKIINYIILD